MQYVDPVLPAANALAKSNPAAGVAGETGPPPNPDDPSTLVQGPITWCVRCTTLLPVLAPGLTGMAFVLQCTLSDFAAATSTVMTSFLPPTKHASPS